MEWLRQLNIRCRLFGCGCKTPRIQTCNCLRTSRKATVLFLLRTRTMLEWGTIVSYPVPSHASGFIKAGSLPALNWSGSASSHSVHSVKHLQTNPCDSAHGVLYYPRTPSQSRHTTSSNNATITRIIASPLSFDPEGEKKSVSGPSYSMWPNPSHPIHLLISDSCSTSGRPLRGLLRENVWTDEIVQVWKVVIAHSRKPSAFHASKGLCLVTNRDVALVFPGNTFSTSAS